MLVRKNDKQPFHVPPIEDNCSKTFNENQLQPYFLKVPTSPVEETLAPIKPDLQCLNNRSTILHQTSAVCNSLHIRGRLGTVKESLVCTFCLKIISRVVASKKCSIRIRVRSKSKNQRLNEASFNQGLVQLQEFVESINLVGRSNAQGGTLVDRINLDIKDGSTGHTIRGLSSRLFN